jgi:hypothetical protein
MTSPILQAWTLCPKKGVTPVQGLLFAHTLVLVLDKAAAKGGIPTIMLLP